jgi:hypothetical protein
LLALNADLARAQAESRLAESGRATRRQRLLVAARAQRRAEEAALRARHLLSATH